MNKSSIFIFFLTSNALSHTCSNKCGRARMRLQGLKIFYVKFTQICCYILINMLLHHVCKKKNFILLAIHNKYLKSIIIHLCGKQKNSPKILFVSSWLLSSVLILELPLSFLIDSASQPVTSVINYHEVCSLYQFKDYWFLKGILDILLVILLLIAPVHQPPSVCSKGMY